MQLQVISGKVTKGKRDRFLLNKNPHVPKKFANARWIYQQIQNKIISPTRTTTANKSTCRNRPEISDDENINFAPLSTSTPIKPKRDLDLSSRSHPRPQSSLFEAEQLLESRQEHHDRSASTRASTFNYHFQVSVSEAAKDVTTSNLINDHDEKSEISWNKTKDDPEDDFPELRFKDVEKTTRSEDMWEECFKMNKSKKTREKKSHDYEKLNSGKNRSSKRRNNEKVAIRNVKKLILYVN